MKDEVELIKASVDLSRAYNRIRNPIIGTQFKNILSVGRETDLLETIRRVDNPNLDVFTLPKSELELYSALIGIDPILLESTILPNFIKDNLIEDLGDKVEIKFKSVSNVYNHGISKIASDFSDKDKSIIDVIAKGMTKPIEETIFDSSIKKFPIFAQKTIKDYLTGAEILMPMKAKDALYYSSPKIFKNKNIFNKVLEVTEGSIVGSILDCISDVPGIPIDAMPKQFNPKIIHGLAIAGAIEPINLDINGTMKEYVFTSDLTLDRADKDHLDLVKKTLANFRFGERYATWTLSSLERFLTSLLDRGYAGKATPIGTDYRTLELSGIVKVEKIPGDGYDRCRFWLLKRDVIQDMLDILKGDIPLTKNIPDINLSSMDNSVLSRITIANSSRNSSKEITDAIRQIQGALF